MTDMTVFLLIQLVELVMFVLILKRVQNSMLAKLKQNFEAVLQFVGEQSFFDTLGNALLKAHEQLDKSIDYEKVLQNEIKLAQEKLTETRKATKTIYFTIATIEGLQS